MVFTSKIFKNEGIINGFYEFTKNGKEKVVVACKDFTAPETMLQDFASLKNTIIDSEHNGYGTELSDILTAIDEQQAVDPYTLKEHFWNIDIKSTCNYTS